VIYREMPDIWDPAFRARFYATWGRENAVISAHAQRVEYPQYQQLLSIKAASGGSERYLVDGRELSVDDDTYLILNANRRYGSRIEEMSPVHSFSIFFAPQQAEQILWVLRTSAQALLEDPDGRVRDGVEFDERIRPHDRDVTPGLTRIQRRLEETRDDELWLEEELKGLLARMLGREHRHRRIEALIPASRPATRREIHRRLGLATDFIHTCYRQRISLKAMAHAAHLSPFHFLRLFKAAHGVSPSAYLNRRRVMAARHLMRRSKWTLIEIAEHVGFGSRTSLFRQLKAHAPRLEGPDERRPDERHV
jgi:AraC-like DNA-binding protein